MPRTTIATVNRMLTDKGVSDRLANGKGYFYFYGPSADQWPDRMVCVASADHLSLDQWWKEYVNLRNG